MIDERRKPLHILQVTGAMNRGGAEVMLMDIYRNMSPVVRFDFLINVKRNNPHVRGDFDDEIERLGGTLRHIGTQWELGPRKYYSQFKKIIQEIGKPDVVHIHMNAKCGVIAMAARMCGIKKIVAHSHAALKFKGPLRKTIPSIVELKLQRMLIGMFATDFWGCSTEANASLFYRRLKHRTIVINNAVDVAAFQNVSKRDTANITTKLNYEGALVLGNVGRVVRHKNVAFVVDVLRVLCERNVNSIFVFAGRADDKTYMAEILEKAKNYGIESRVIHLGDRNDIPAVMSAFDVFVGPALNEGFGLVAAEAQATGVPCVLSTGFPQTVDLNLGLVSFVKNSDPKEWADAILRERDNKCLDRDMIQNRIKERGFDAAENAKRIESLYRA